MGNIKSANKLFLNVKQNLTLIWKSDNILLLRYCNEYRSNRPNVFCNEGGHKNFIKFTRKRLCRCFFFMMLQARVEFFQIKFFIFHWFMLMNLFFIRKFYFWNQERFILNRNIWFRVYNLISLNKNDFWVALNNFFSV